MWTCYFYIGKQGPDAHIQNEILLKYIYKVLSFPDPQPVNMSIPI